MSYGGPAQRPMPQPGGYGRPQPMPQRGQGGTPQRDVMPPPRGSGGGPGARYARPQPMPQRNGGRPQPMQGGGRPQGRPMPQRGGGGRPPQMMYGGGGYGSGAQMDMMYRVVTKIDLYNYISNMASYYDLMRSFQQQYQYHSTAAQSAFDKEKAKAALNYAPGNNSGGTSHNPLVAIMITPKVIKPLKVKRKMQ